MTACVILTTLGTEEDATRLARQLVERQLAACVNVLPTMTSVYRWKGTVHEDPEVLLVIKSVRERYPALEAAIRELHPYELPEILCFDADRGGAAFLTWIGEMVESD